MYVIADPKISTRITTRIKFSILLKPQLNYFFSAYSAAIFLSVFWIKPKITATIPITTIRPGTKPAPKDPVVISVPIWYTKKPMVYPVQS